VSAADEAQSSGLAASPADGRASIAVDLGAESCRVSLLRWRDGQAEIALVHRFPNGPERDAEGALRWPLPTILAGVDEGMRMCAERAPEGVRSVAVDGWAVDYVRADASGEPLAAPFCYRDERTSAAEQRLHERISPARLREITGIQRQPINTLYQLYADRLAGLAAGARWLNLPEFVLARWGGEAVSEYTNATHTEMVELENRRWSREICEAAEIGAETMPRMVGSGTRLGRLRGEHARLPAFRETELIAPACHDTASAIAGIADEREDWGYISSGTWSLVGTVLEGPRNGAAARAAEFTNLGAVDDRILFQKNVNGMWLLRQCMEAWSAAGGRWEIEELCAAAERVATPEGTLDVDDPELLLMERMPERINAQRTARGYAALDTSPAGAPAMASLIFHSLAARYAGLLTQMEELTGKRLARIHLVGGGSRNALLRRLTEQASGRTVLTGSAESSTLGNFAVQLAALDRHDRGDGEPLRRRAAQYLRCFKF
jgi:rhamnulokinase